MAMQLARSIARPGLLLVLAALAAPAATGPVAAQAVPGDPDAPPVAPSGDIVVTARRQVEIRAAIKQLTASRGGQIPRWNSTFCLAIYGAGPDQRRIVSDAIVRAAKDAGASVITDKCMPDARIVLTKDADTFARDFRKFQPDLYKDTYRFGLPQRDERALWLDPAPVRWLVQSGIEVGLGFASHISQPVRESKVRMMVLVDLPRCDGKTWQQLADYLAMVVLANPRQGEPNTPGSIMTLFDGSDATATPTGLSGLDRATLKALYLTNAQVSTRWQRLAIRSYVMRNTKDR